MLSVSTLFGGDLNRGSRFMADMFFVDVVQCSTVQMYKVWTDKKSESWMAKKRDKLGMADSSKQEIYTVHRLARILGLQSDFLDGSLQIVCLCSFGTSWMCHSMRNFGRSSS